MQTKTKTELIQEAHTLLDTRDIRFYGVYGFSFQDSLALSDHCYALPVEQNDTLIPLYRVALDSGNMDELDVWEMVRKLRKCPPRPKAVS